MAAIGLEAIMLMADGLGISISLTCRLRKSIFLKKRSTQIQK
jgi:hypothetical protein